MIINISRSNQFQQCHKKAWFYDEGLVQLGIAQPLITGSAYHKGAAVLTSQRDLPAALAAAEGCYRDELAKVPMVLPEELALHNQNIVIVKRMIEAQAKVYLKDAWTVLKPEVEFMVALPNTWHHCWYCHRLLYPNTPFSECDANLNPPNTIGERQSCWQQHYLRGKTDGILQYNNMIWILERKTSGMKQNIFWDQWYLSHQLSAYVYGGRKATGMEIAGVILEKMPKPARNQNPLTFDFSPEREPYLRSQSDLDEFEREISAIASDYERAASIGKSAFYRNPQSCIDYNRRCDYWDACKRGYVNDGEFRKRDIDYVEAAYYTLLGMEAPSCSSAENVEEKSL